LLRGDHGLEPLFVCMWGKMNSFKRQSSSGRNLGIPCIGAQGPHFTYHSAFRRNFHCGAIPKVLEPYNVVKLNGLSNTGDTRQTKRRPRSRRFMRNSIPYSAGRRQGFEQEKERSRQSKVARRPGCQGNRHHGHCNVLAGGCRMRSQGHSVTRTKSQCGWFTTTLLLGTRSRGHYPDHYPGLDGPDIPPNRSYLMDAYLKGIGYGPVFPFGDGERGYVGGRLRGWRGAERHFEPPLERFALGDKVEQALGYFIGRKASTGAKS